MRYHYERPEKYNKHYGQVYSCDHPIYNECTLFTLDEKGIAIIQERHNPMDKTNWWGPIDPWLNDELYLNSSFYEFLNEFADYPKHGLYPTVTIRRAMYWLKMKPLPKESWETTFNRNYI